MTRIATIALVYTGLSREAARFQARSAFTGVGFTTSEAEMVMQHPVRRRIVMWLMFFGNVGIVTGISSLLLTFINPNTTQGWIIRLVLLASGIILLWVVANSRWIDRLLSRLIKGALHRWTRMDVRDYFRLLNLTGDYEVMEMTVDPEDWLADQTLADLGLRQEGIVVLGVRRANGRYLGAPKGETHIHAQDTLTLYGRSQLLDELEQRRSGPEGESAHRQAVADQQQVLQEQEQQDAAENQ